MKLYTYYRSQASFRVRIALNLKGIARGDSFLHLEKGDQFAAEYRAINPQMVVPTLIDGDVKLFQSLAILEYLEEKFPEPPLLPADAQARAWVRGIALINAGRLAPADRTARSKLSDGCAEGQQRAKTRVDPALARYRPRRLRRCSPNILRAGYSATANGRPSRISVWSRR